LQPESETISVGKRREIATDIRIGKRQKLLEPILLKDVMNLLSGEKATRYAVEANRLEKIHVEVPETRCLVE